MNSGFEIARIVDRKGKAYIPSFGQTPDRMSINVDPVYVVELDREQAVAVFEKDEAAAVL